MLWALVWALLAIGLAACGSTSSSRVPAVTEAWARATPAGATTGAVYLTLTSPVDDRLIEVGVTVGVAASAQMHDTVIDAAGVASMTEVPSVELPARTAVSFEPLGRHIMLTDLARPLEVGTTFELRLVFERAGALHLTIPVLADAPGT